MKKLTTALNLDEEVNNLAEFIAQKWTPISNLEALFTEIRDAALHAARAWFDQHAVWEVATEMEDKRTALLEANLNMGFKVYPALYDAQCTLLSSVARSTGEVRNSALDLDGDWDYTRRVRAVELSLGSRYPDLAGARPLGWDALAKAYNDFDGQEEYDPRPDRELFKGVLVQGTFSGSFTSRVALPYVMYDEKCQSYKAAHVLVGAVFAHFLGIAEYLNTEKLKKDLVDALPDVATPEMMFERNLQTDNPILKVMFELATTCRSKAEFETCLASYAEYEALSDEEKAARKAANSEKISEIMSRLMSKSDSEAEDKKQAEAKQHRNNLLRAAFSVA